MKRLREASLEKVKAVDGVGPKLAEQIVRALEGAPNE
jgi:DNA uptake protein ComE-like DNA-binding protein